MRVRIAGRVFGERSPGGSQAIAGWMTWWLVGSTAVLLGSLGLLGVDVVMGFAYFGEPKWPVWFWVLGVLAVAGVGLGFAGFVGLMVVAGYRERKSL